MLHATPGKPKSDPINFPNRFQLPIPGFKPPNQGLFAAGVGLRKAGQMQIGNPGFPEGQEL